MVSRANPGIVANDDPRMWPVAPTTTNGSQEPRHSGGHVPDEGDDVGHDAGDVVRAAARVGGLDQPPGRLLGIGHATQRVTDDLRADHGGQAVRAQQVPVAQPRLADLQIRLGLRGPVEGAQQQGSLRMCGGLVRADPAVVHQRLDQRVIVGDLPELATGQ